MVTLLRSCFLPFAVALLIGLAAGRMTAPAKGADPVLASKNKRETPLRGQRGRLDWEDLLREYEAEDLREIETGLDAMDRLLDGWSADELRTALDQALQTPECVDPMGAGDRRIDELFGAWIRRDPHAAAAWVVDVHSGEIRDRLVRVACHHWPKDRAMECIGFVLEHHWKPGAYFHHGLITAALEKQGLQGASAVEQLLRRLKEAEVDVVIESISLPADFNYRQLVDTETFRDEDDEITRSAVFSRWIATGTLDFLGWMENTGSWREFNRFFTPADAAKLPEAIAYVARQDPAARAALLNGVNWRELELDDLSRFARGLEGSDAQMAWVAKAVEGSLPGSKADIVPILALIPSVDRQVEALMQVDPHTDWRPGHRAETRRHTRQGGDSPAPPGVGSTCASAPPPSRSLCSLMRIPLQSGVMALAGLGLGLMVSRPGGGAAPSVETPPSPARIPSIRPFDGRHVGESGRYDPEHTLQSLLHIDHDRLNNQGSARRIKTASSQNLRELAVELSAPELARRGLAVGNLRRRIVRELYRRDGAGALAWAEKLECPIVFGEFIACLAHDDVLAAVNLFGPYKEKMSKYYESMRNSALGSNDPWHIDSTTGKAAIRNGCASFSEAALVQGLDTALQVKKAMREDEHDWLCVGSLPEGFDFVGLMGRLEPDDIRRPHAMKDIFESWAVRDPDAALAHALALDKMEPTAAGWIFPSMFDGMSKMQGDAAAAVWLSEALSQYPESDRSRVLSNLEGRTGAPSPADFRKIVEALPDEADKIAYGANGIPPIFGEDHPALS